MINFKLRPAESLKKIGIESVKELSDLTGTKERTLFNWFRSNKKRFNAIAVGASVIKKEVK